MGHWTPITSVTFDFEASLDTQARQLAESGFAVRARDSHPAILYVGECSALKRQGGK
jgi:hypothetical protein